MLKNTLGLITGTILLAFLLPSQALTNPIKQKDTAKIQVIPRYQSTAYEQRIAMLYRSVPASHSPDIAKRVAADSAYFLGAPYLLGALGEGPNGQFDKDPLFRTDAFDCQTYASTVLALAQANNLGQFEHLIIKIRYANSRISYPNRNHFASVDWNNNNTYNGYIKDITYKITDADGKPLAEVANTIINKPNWYKYRSGHDIKWFHQLNSSKVLQLIANLHANGNHFKQERSVLLYVPLAKMFDPKGNPIKAIFAQIPSGSIIEIVRPNWQIANLIGTNLNISHLGLAIRTKNGLMFRNASSTQHKVVDTILSQYLHHYLHSPTVKGIHIEKIVFPPA